VEKYVDIVVDVLILKNKFFNWYIFIYFMVYVYLRYWEDFLMHLIYPMFVDAIDWSHILFYQKLNKWDVIYVNSYYKWKNCN
jgi:hypothetical protein